MTTLSILGACAACVIAIALGLISIAVCLGHLYDLRWKGMQQEADQNWRGRLMAYDRWFAEDERLCRVLRDIHDDVDVASSRERWRKSKEDPSPAGGGV